MTKAMRPAEEGGPERLERGEPEVRGATSSEPKFSLFREEVRRTWTELRGARLSPMRGAVAVFLGVFIGSQPIFGCHTPLVLALCIWFQLDGALAWIASNISNPFFAPFLVTAEVWVGGSMIEGQPVRLDQKITSFGAAFTEVPRYLFAGAPVVGLGLALVLGGATWGVLAVRKRLGWTGQREPYHLPAHAPAWIRAVERVAGRYAPAELSSPRERTQFHYVRIKLVSDPVAQLIADLGGTHDGALGEVLDVGTGRGQLPIALLELGRATKARGSDWDEAKIADAVRAAQGKPAGATTALPELPATFTREDARSAQIAPADTVLLIDLIHYFTLEEQDGILTRAARAVRPGGRIVIREADTERGFRSFMTLFEERLFTFLRFNRGERVQFRSARSIGEVLTREGLSVEVKPAWGSTPFSNVLIVGRRPAAARAAPANAEGTREGGTNEGTEGGDTPDDEPRP